MRAFFFRSALENGGSCSVERGVDVNKREILKRELGDATWNLMRTIKHTFDENNILNPSKIFVTNGEAA